MIGLGAFQKSAAADFRPTDFLLMRNSCHELKLNKADLRVQGNSTDEAAPSGPAAAAGHVRGICCNG